MQVFLRRVFLVVFISFLFFSLAAFAGKHYGSDVFANGDLSVPEPQDTFPVPYRITNQLFYLQRTTNTNTIVYSLNIGKDGKLIESNPVKVFWIRYPEGGMIKDLNMLQKTFAYGTLSHKNTDGSFAISLVSYKKYEMTLKKSPKNNGFAIHSLINKRDAILSRIFVKIDPGGSLFSPNIAYVEVLGRDAETGKPLMERFKP